MKKTKQPTSDQLQQQILEMQKALAELQRKEQMKAKIPEKQERRGRPELWTVEDKAWVIDHLKLDTHDAKELQIALSNARGRPIRLIKQKTVKFGKPLHTREIYRNELTSCPYGIGCVFENVQAKTIISEFITISSENYNQVITTEYNNENRTQKVLDAMAAIDAINLDKRPYDNPYNGVRDYIDIANTLKKSGYSHPTDQLPTRVGFALALAFVCKGYKPDNKDELLKWDFVCQSLQNIELPKDVPDFNWDTFLEQCIQAFSRHLVRNQRTSRKGISSKAHLLATAIFHFKEKLRLKHYPTEIFKKIEELTENVIRSLSGELYVEDNYPALPLTDVKTILDAAWNVDQRLYHRIVLQLSTAIRVNEINRLSVDFLDKSNNRMIYNRAVNGVFLSAKTTNKVDRRKLANAQTSLVTRVVLKNFDFKADAEIIEKFWQLGSDLRKALITEDGFERSLRTTAATNLMYGTTSRICVKTDYSDVQARMSHINPHQVTTRYAKQPPVDIDRARNIDEYLSIRPLILENGKQYKIHATENAWDLWLLRDFINRHGLKAVQKFIYDEIKEVEVYAPEEEVLKIG